MGGLTWAACDCGSRFLEEECVHVPRWELRAVEEKRSHLFDQSRGDDVGGDWVPGGYLGDTGCVNGRRNQALLPLMLALLLATWWIPLSMVPGALCGCCC